MLNMTVWQVCDTVCVDDQEHEDFHAEHPVAAAQGKTEGWGWLEQRRMGLRVSELLSVRA